MIHCGSRGVSIGFREEAGDANDCDQQSLFPLSSINFSAGQKTYQTEPSLSSCMLQRTDVLGTSFDIQDIDLRRGLTDSSIMTVSIDALSQQDTLPLVEMNQIAAANINKISSARVPFTDKQGISYDIDEIFEEELNLFDRSCADQHKKTALDNASGNFAVEENYSNSDNGFTSRPSKESITLRGRAYSESVATSAQSIVRKRSSSDSFSSGLKKISKVSTRSLPINMFKDMIRQSYLDSLDGSLDESTMDNMCHVFGFSRKRILKAFNNHRHYLETKIQNMLIGMDVENLCSPLINQIASNVSATTGKVKNCFTKYSQRILDAIKAKKNRSPLASITNT